MANAIPVGAKAEPKTRMEIAAEEQKQLAALTAEAVKVEHEDLKAVVSEAKAEKKTIQVYKNAVRVDN